MSPTVADYRTSNLLILYMPAAVTAEVASSSLVVPAIHSKEVMNRWRFPHRCKKVHLFPSISSLLPIGLKISTCSGRCSQGARIIRNQKSNDCLLGLALGRRDRLRVSVQRQPRRGMPEQILLNLYVSSKGPK